MATAVLALAGTAWLPSRALRSVGGAWAALGLLVGLRPLLGFAPACVVALGLGAAAGWRLPEALLRRIAFALPSLLLLTYVTAVLMYMAPGSPFANERAAPPEVEEALRERYGVPDSATAFFAVYLERLVVDGTLGPSIKVQGRSVEELLLPALPVSLSLGVLALVLSVVLGVALGVRAGLRPGSGADLSSMGLALIGVSLPNFVVGAVLMLVFGIGLGWLPVAGWGGYRHLILPAITLALPTAAYVARLTRSGTIDVMRQDFIRTARAKGLPERMVVAKHALRGALLPVVSFLGPAAAAIMTGSFVVETLFGVPGMGQWFVKGAINRDYSVVMGTALIYFAMITAFNLAVDLMLAWLDPRLRDEL
ncbi:MAG: ABC transporter permease [Myxococcota bacterium]|nr:ABC transporter permease [Myxococcota bacterium]MDP6242817.1 ABC transporter permease [Myxococcota bacterium]MDP7076322.1 ABC transporter permease [Myxococcota bacterium]MDP7300006.1 ABC transporter permease [Myxococcota bacterium]MDP7432750.1 ABC transporter permease [Myxococcota bacterium]